MSVDEMDPIVLKALIKEAISESNPFSIWVYLLLFILPSLGVFVASYLRKKAENLATKEDIKGITEEIEKIRSKYSEQLETYKASLELSNQLKLSALDKRLQKHQEAFTLWLELIWNMGQGDKIGPVSGKCQKWWDNNCLYLSEVSRGAFKKALILAGNYHQLTNSEDKRKWFDDIMSAGEKIIKDVELPPLGYDEIRTPKDYEENHNE